MRNYKNIYYRSEFKINGEIKNVRLIKNLLKKEKVNF